MNEKQQEQDAFLLSHVQDMLRKNAWRSFTAFLDMRQYTMLKPYLRDGNHRFFGGHPSAERGILCIHPEDAPPEDDEFPITCLTFTFRKADKISHRDVLGSLMAQQLQRSMIGDIFISPGRVQCFVTGAAAAVGLQISKIGRVGVRVTDEIPFTDDYQQEKKEISGTVASPRLDAVLRTALPLGRDACAELIVRRMVTVNYQEAEEPSLQLKEGDVFSVRGYGKFRLKSISTPTKKGRLHVIIEKYL